VNLRFNGFSKRLKDIETSILITFQNQSRTIFGVVAVLLPVNVFQSACIFCYYLVHFSLFEDE